MVRDFVANTKRGDVVKLTRPPMRWRYHYSLAVREAIHRRYGGNARTPDEVADTDPAWESDVYRVMELIKFHENALENPVMFAT